MLVVSRAAAVFAASALAGRRARRTGSGLPYGLVVQGLISAPVIRRLGVAEEGDPRVDARHLHRMVTEAALEQIRRADDVPAEVRAAVLQQYEAGWPTAGRSRASSTATWAASAPGSRCGHCWPGRRRLRPRWRSGPRRSGQISPAAADHVHFDVEARALRYRS